MKNHNQEASGLMLTFAGNESADAIIYINDVESGRVAAGITGTAVIPVPEDLAREKVLTVMIVPDAKERTPHFFEVRLMRNIL